MQENLQLLDCELMYLLVDLHANGTLGHVPYSASTAMIDLVWHTLLKVTGRQSTLQPALS